MISLFSNGQIYLIIAIYLWIAVLLESSHLLNRLKYILFGVSTVVLCLFIGCRWEVGTDWDSYKKLFDTVDDFGFSLDAFMEIYHFDLGYIILNAVVKLFTSNYTVFLLINSGITIIFLSWIIKRVTYYPNLSLFFFYCGYMISQFMGSNRRMMAMVFTLFSFYYIFNYKKNKYGFFVLLSFLFHRSSIISIISFFIPRQLFSLKQIFCFISTSLIFGLLQIPAKFVDILGHYLSLFINHPLITAMVFYSENNEDHIVYGTGDMFLSTVLAMSKRCFMVLFYLYILRNHKVDGQTKWYFNIYIISICGYLMFVGSAVQILTAYFAIIEILLIGRIFKYTSENNKLIFWSVISLYGLLQITNAVNIYPELYLPYKSMLDKF